MTALLVLFLAAGSSPATQEAERLAANALTLPSPAAGVTEARKALAMTEDFEPTEFVKAGRKGEVVEDAYLAAREEYRHHRAKLYAALGQCLLKARRAQDAARYLGRAVLLDPAGGSLPELSSALLAAGKGRAALLLLGRPEIHPTPDALEAAADAAEVPSAQAEMDRIRILAAGLVFRDGPFTPPPGVHLSTGGPLVLSDPSVTTLVYEAEATCKSCSEDLLVLKHASTLGARVVLVPQTAARDQALREILNVYHLSFPILVGESAAGGFHLSPRALLIVARGGWSAAEMKAPFSQIDAALKIFATSDLKETLPRPAWNHRPVDRSPLPAPPEILPEGLAPGEDLPAPESFPKAVEAFRGGRPRDAQALLDALAASGDGWLLPPEARLDRALCLAASGQKEVARKLLLKTGDSRFQDAVDRALESVASR
jgi:hypothetical protein